MSNANVQSNGKTVIRDNHSMWFHNVMKFGLMEALIAAVVFSVINLFSLKEQYGVKISSTLDIMTTWCSVFEIIIILVGVVALLGFFLNRKFCVPSLTAFSVLLIIDRLILFVLISISPEAVSSEGNTITTDQFLPAYALWNLRLVFFAIVVAVVLIKYYSERKNMFK